MAGEEERSASSKTRWRTAEGGQPSGEKGSSASNSAMAACESSSVGGAGSTKVERAQLELLKMQKELSKKAAAVEAAEKARASVMCVGGGGCGGGSESLRKSLQTSKIERDRRRLFVSNLPMVLGEADVSTIFAAFSVVQIDWPTDPFGGGKGYCFIEFVSEAQALAVMGAMQASRPRLLSGHPLATARVACAHVVIATCMLLCVL